MQRNSAGQIRHCGFCEPSSEVSKVDESITTTICAECAQKHYGEYVKRGGTYQVPPLIQRMFEEYKDNGQVHSARMIRAFNRFYIFELIKAFGNGEIEKDEYELMRIYMSERLKEARVREEEDSEPL